MNEILSEEETKRMLDGEKKVAIRIRSDDDNPSYKTEAVRINGYVIQIPVGEDVLVPMTVHEILVKRGII